MTAVNISIPGADPGFQVRGGGRGGGAHLKKLHRAEGGAKLFGVLWKITILRQKSYFFRLRREARKFLRYFVLRQKIIFFPILGGARAGCAPPPPPPPWIRPCILTNCIPFQYILLAHLTQRVMWAIAITWRPSSSYVVNFKQNLVWIITRVSGFKIVSCDAVHQPTWPLLLKIEHMVKLQVLGNISKTVDNIKNLTWSKNDQHIKIYLPCNFEVNLITPSWSYCPFFIKFVKF